MSMTHDEMIAVIEHHKNGGKVQYKRKYETSEWLDTDPMWDFSTCDYRKKPDPIYIYASVSSTGRILFATAEKDEYIRFADATKTPIKKFVEVSE